MSDLGDTLMFMWLVYWFSAAFLGTFFGVLTAWGARIIYRKIKRWANE